MKIFDRFKYWYYIGAVERYIIEDLYPDADISKLVTYAKKYRDTPNPLMVIYIAKALHNGIDDERLFDGSFNFEQLYFIMRCIQEHIRIDNILDTDITPDNFCKYFSVMKLLPLSVSARKLHNQDIVTNDDIDSVYTRLIDILNDCNLGI